MSMKPGATSAGARDTPWSGRTDRGSAAPHDATASSFGDRHGDAFTAGAERPTGIGSLEIAFRWRPTSGSPDDAVDVDIAPRLPSGTRGSRGRGADPFGSAPRPSGTAGRIPIVGPHADVVVAGPTEPIVVGRPGAIHAAIEPIALSPDGELVVVRRSHGGLRP